MPKNKWFHRKKKQLKEKDKENMIKKLRQKEKKRLNRHATEETGTNEILIIIIKIIHD